MAPSFNWKIKVTNSCVEKWTIIAYQDYVFNTTEYQYRNISYQYDQGDPLTNFFDLTTIDQFEGTNGLWKFKFEWELEGGTLTELIWTQNFNPDGDILTTSTPVVAIESMVAVACTDTSDPDAITLG